MSWSIRRATLILAAVTGLLTLALMQNAHAQRAQPVRGPRQPVGLQAPGPTGVDVGPGIKNPDEFSDSITLPKDPALGNKILAVPDYIRNEDWQTAVKALQEVIELDKDVFVQVSRAGPDGQQAKVWTSVKSEAARIIKDLPPAGKEYYGNTCGPLAAALLRQYKESSDVDLLKQIYRRYLYTESGAEATDLLATYMLDRGDFTMAAMCYERLIGRDGPDKVDPLTLFKAAYAFHQAGDSVNEDKTWTDLNRRTREIKVGGELRSVADLRTYVSALTKGENTQNLANWPMFGGNLARNGRGEGDTAFMEPKWPKIATVEPATIRDRLAQAERRMMDTNQPVLPAFFPVTAIANTKTGPVPIVVCRTHYGLYAFDVRTGERKWRTPSDGSIERLLAQNQFVTNVTSWIDFYTNAGRPNILFENSTIGTLSTDGNLVFSIDDLAVPPPPQMQGGDIENPRIPQGATMNKDLKDLILCSRLRAYNFANGKLIWEVGGRGEAKNELHDSYFLGPPIALGGKLYVLSERNQDLRLITLEAATGKLLQIQQLATTRDKMQIDVARRVQAAHLCYGEGMLVCPTNAGAILGIDLLTNSLVWAFSYREKSDVAHVDPPQPIQPGRPRPVPQPRQYNPNENNHWKVSAPIIQDGKVVFAAPDGQRIYCLNLRDGRRLWDQRRLDEDLYLGGVYNGKVLVVGKKTVRALTLNKGETLWSLETGMPSGQGVASGDIYYLPIKSNKDKEPEIAAIDIDNGRFHAHTRSRKKEVPGNLVFFEGTVISQSIGDIVAYPQLKAKLAQIDALIAKNPNDPVGLAERGDLRLDRGDLQGAVEDLLASLKNTPPDDLKPKVRAKLFETLTEFLQRDFNAAEKYVPNYEELCTVDLTGATGEEKAAREAESRRRRANYLFLVANGKESQGKLVEAFEKYMEFGGIAGGTNELFTVIDAPTVKAAPDIWAQGRIAAMVAKAKPADREPLEKLIAERWAKVKDSNDPEELRKFVVVFGNLFDVGKEARLKLAEKLMESTDATVLLDAERHLTILRGRNEKPEMAARAVEALARLNTKRGLLEDAAYFYEMLYHDYPNIKVRDGKTGADIFNELATDKRLLPFLDRPNKVGLNIRMKATELRESFPLQYQTYYFDHAGENLPFFQQHQIALRHDLHQFKLYARTADAKEKWSQGLTRTGFQNIVQQATHTRFNYMSHGHLVVLPLGHMVFGIDPVAQKVLWERNLHAPIMPAAGTAPNAGVPGSNPPIVDPRDGSILIAYTEGWTQRLGQTGPLEGSVICLQAREGLMAIDPISGRVLWIRSDIGSRAKIFGDADTIYVVEMTDQNQPALTRALRATDGVAITVPNFTDQYTHARRQIGCTLILQDSDGMGNVIVHQYDIKTGKDLWHEKLPAGYTLATTEDPNLVAAVSGGEGKVRVYDLKKKKEIVTLPIDPAHLNGNQGVTVLFDGTYYVVAINGPTDPNTGAAQPNLLPNTGMRSIPVNGELYCFTVLPDRVKLTGRFNLVNQMLVIDYFQEMPVMLLTARYTKRNVGPMGNMPNLVSLVCIDKKTGKRLYDNDSDPSPANGGERKLAPMPAQMYFHSLVVDARSNRIEFTGPQMKLVVEPDDGKR
jgi:outer membrane protein assembly factor BamB/tetratricopeptide (TPR) repeat protein